MNNVMRYKGYWAKVQYSEEDECFWGKVEGLKRSLILFEGDTVKDLKKDFREAIDHYLDGNDNPEKPCKGSLNVRLGTELHSEAKIKSIEKNISINELIKEAVALYLKVNS